MLSGVVAPGASRPLNWSMIRCSVEPPGPKTRILSVFVFVAPPQGDPLSSMSDPVTASVANSPGPSVAVTSSAAPEYEHVAAAAVPERPAPTAAATISAAESLNATLILTAVSLPKASANCQPGKWCQQKPNHPGRPVGFVPR